MRLRIIFTEGSGTINFVFVLKSVLLSAVIMLFEYFLLEFFLDFVFLWQVYMMMTSWLVRHNFLTGIFDIFPWTLSWNTSCGFFYVSEMGLFNFSKKLHASYGSLYILIERVVFYLIVFIPEDVQHFRGIDLNLFTEFGFGNYLFYVDIELFILDSLHNFVSGVFSKTCFGFRSGGEKWLNCFHSIF